MSFDNRRKISVSPKLYELLNNLKRVLKNPVHIETWEELLYRLSKEAKK